MSISPQSGARGLKRLIWLLYYMVLKLQITFNLELNAAKNTHYFKKSIKWKLFKIEFVPKVQERVRLFPPELSYDPWKIDMVEI